MLSPLSDILFSLLGSEILVLRVYVFYFNKKVMNALGKQLNGEKEWKLNPTRLHDVM